MSLFINILLVTLVYELLRKILFVNIWVVEKNTFRECKKQHIYLSHLHACVLNLHDGAIYIFILINSNLLTLIDHGNIDVDLNGYLSFFKKIYRHGNLEAYWNGNDKLSIIIVGGQLVGS